MGGRGTYAVGNNVDYTYKTVDKIEGVKVLKGTENLHDLPLYRCSLHYYQPRKILYRPVRFTLHEEL